MPEIKVRRAELHDIERLVQIEIQTWSGDGSPLLSHKDLMGWLEEDSPLFLVAEIDDEVCGYYFGRQVNFSFDEIDGFINSAIIRSGTWTSSHMHTPDGKVSYGLSIASVIPTAGKIMNERAIEIWKELGLTHSIGFTRLSGLDEYLRLVELQHENKLPYPVEAIALWYAHENARLLHMRSWQECTPKPELELPELPKTDPVLRFHARVSPIGLLRVVPNYMPDKSSRNFAAFIALETADIL